MGKNEFTVIEVKSIWNAPKQWLFRRKMMLLHRIRTRYGLLRRAIRRATAEELVSPEATKQHVELINA